MRTETNKTTPLGTDLSAIREGELDFSEFMDGLAVDMKGYVLAEKEHLVLQATEKAAVMLSKTLQQATFFSILGAVLLFLSLALALFLGDLLASRPLGFAILGGAYAILLGAYQLWWSQGGRERSILELINDLNSHD
jgi:hypothetical protein